MIVPNKVIPFSDSIISKMLVILNVLEKSTEIELKTLYSATQEQLLFDEFIYSLDALYILDFIEIEMNSGVIKYAQRD